MPPQLCFSVSPPSHIHQHLLLLSPLADAADEESAAAAAAGKALASGPVLLADADTRQLLTQQLKSGRDLIQTPFGNLPQISEKVGGGTIGPWQLPPSPNWQLLQPLHTICCSSAVRVLCMCEAYEACCHEQAVSSWVPQHCSCLLLAGIFHLLLLLLLLSPPPGPCQAGEGSPEGGGSSTRCL
jgi:hypothetical protein